MKKSIYQTPPVLLLAFNRIETTEKVFEAIRNARPKKLFLAVDGPRKDNKEDEIGIQKVKDLIKRVDWPCKIKTLFRKENLGCRDATSGAMNWFFDNVEEGIIFDDDCVPKPEFFIFCAELLEKYRDDDRIMHISGYTFQKGWSRNDYSYYFSNYPYIWGWAGWSKKRKKFDLDMKNYPKLKKGGFLKDIYPNFVERKMVERILDGAYYNKNLGPDTQWLLTVISNNGLSIVPNKNMIDNIGFSEKGLHTKPIDSYLYMKTEVMEFPLKHPPFIIRDRIADERYAKWIMKKKIKKHLLLKTGLHKILKV